MGHRPTGEENPSNGWSWVCSIRGAEHGPLAGRTVGVKDNVAVAGIPMLNGSPIMEGYVAIEDATVVTRVRDAGETSWARGPTRPAASTATASGDPEPQPTTARPGGAVRRLRRPAGPMRADVIDCAARADATRPTTASTRAIAVGAYLSERHNHHYYAKAQNLGRRLRRS